MHHSLAEGCGMAIIRIEVQRISIAAASAKLCDLIHRDDNVLAHNSRSLRT